MGLLAEIRGEARSLDEAVEEFARIAQSLSAVLAFIGNTTVDEVIPELAYDISPGLFEREYFQNFMPEDPVSILKRRRVDGDIAVRVLVALDNHSERDRLRRAIGQYYEALQTFDPAVRHLRWHTCGWVWRH